MGALEKAVSLLPHPSEQPYLVDRHAAVVLLAPAGPRHDPPPNLRVEEAHREHGLPSGARRGPERVPRHAVEDHHRRLQEPAEGAGAAPAQVAGR